MPRFTPLSLLASTLLIAAAATGSVVAQDATEAGRYTIVERPDGVIRVDRETGVVDQCTVADGKLTCRLAADERAAWQREGDAMGDRVSDLEKRIARLERDGVPAEPSAKVPGLSDTDQAELDKALGTAETIMRRFFGMVKTLSKDMSNP